MSQTLTERDWEILKTVNTLRLVAANQIERLHFWDLKETTRPVVRRRVLKRLSDAGVILALPRRVGGKQFGSAQQMFTLNSAGLELLHDHYGWKDTNPRKVTVPGALFHQHRLAVSELYVQLQEKSRQNIRALEIETFESEPDCWWPYAKAEERTNRPRNSRPQGFLKPDAYIFGYGNDSNRAGAFWIEVDLNTEAVHRVWRKVGLYENFKSDTTADKPHGFMPHILITTPTQRRRDRIKNALDTWEWGWDHNPLSDLISVRVECFDQAVNAIMDDLPADGA